MGKVCVGSIGNQRVARDRRMGDSGSKPRAKSDKGDRPLKEPRNNVAPNHIVKILVRSR